MKRSASVSASHRKKRAGSATLVGSLVVAGTETSTASLLWVYEAEGDRPPKPGDLSIVLDGRDHPVCIIVTTEVRIIPFDEMVDQKRPIFLK
jgi:uncharacterized protein YhfF